MINFEVDFMVDWDCFRQFVIMIHLYADAY